MQCTYLPRYVILCYKVISQYIYSSIHVNSISDLHTSMYACIYACKHTETFSLHQNNYSDLINFLNKVDRHIHSSSELCLTCQSIGCKSTLSSFDCYIATIVLCCRLMLTCILLSSGKFGGSFVQIYSQDSNQWLVQRPKLPLCSSQASERHSRPGNILGHSE